MSRTLLLLSKAILVIACCFGLVRQAQGQIALITASDGGFENATSTLAANGWIVADGTAVTWFVGTAAGASTGTKAAFVGSSNTVYTGSTATVIKHFYRDIAIPAGATSVFLNYKLKMPIVDCCTFDFFRVYTNTTAQTPVSGTLPAGTQRAVYNTPALANFTAQPQIDLTSLAGTTVRLVFTYQTDAASPFANPAVDDITLTYLAGGGPCSSIAAATCGVANALTIASGTGVYNPPSATCGFNTPGQEKVYSFTSTSAGTYTIQQNSSFGYIDYFFKTQAGGCSGTGWTCIDDLNGAVSANFTLAASTAYYILLDPEGSGGGSVNFTINCPATDPCTSPTALAACGTTQSVTLSGSGAGWNVTSCGFSTPGQEKVYTYTPPTTGLYSLEVTSSTGTYIDYFWKLASGGCSSTGWSCINDVFTTGVVTSDVPMNFTAGVPVLLLLDPEATASVTQVFRLNCPPTPPACVGSPTSPTNGATGIAVTGTTLSWPSVSGATGYDVYLGTTTPPSTLVSSNQVGLTYATGALSGSTTYYWRIEPRNAVGPATGCTNWNFVTAAGPPSNDNCANAIAIASLPYTSAVIPNALATDDSPTSSCDGPYKNVWWTVTGICGTMTAITCTGSTNFDDEIAVFTSSGGCSGPWTQVACNDDNGAGCTSNYAGVSWTGTAGTTYYITVGSYFTGTATGNLQLNVTATPFTSSVAPTGVSGTTSICAGGSTTLTVTGGTVGAGAVAQWFTGSCGGTAAGTGPSVSVSPSTTTTYYVRYSGTCNTTTCYAVTVVVNAPPAVSIAPANSTICAGGSATLTATGVPSNALADVLASINGQSALLQASVPTPYGFAMDGTNGVNGTSIFDGGLDMYDGGNSINTNLASQITYSDNTVLSSASFGTGGQYFTRYFAASGGNASLFIWAGDINGLTSLSITGNNGADGIGLQNTTSFTVSANGVTYTCLLKRVYNASDPSINQLFLIPTPNSAAQTIGSTTDDSQQNITGISGVTRFYYMLYAGASGALIDDATAQSIAQTFVNVLPTANTYTWSPGGATTAAISVSPGTTTTYTVTYNNGICSNTATRQVTVNPLPTASASGGGTVCSDQTLPNVTFTFTGTPPYNFTYNPGGVSVTGHNSNAYTITNAAAGTYAVTALTDANCTGTDFGSSATVTVNPAATASAGGPYATCGTTAVAISATANGSGTWSGGAGTFASATSTSTTYTPTAGEVGGSVSLTWTTDDPDGAGPCGTAANSATLTVHTPPVVACGTYGPVCADAADISLGGSPSGGTWSGTGVTGNSFDPSAGTQTLTYTYTDGNNCTSSCQTTITVDPLPVVTCGSYGPVCTDAADITLGGSPSGGTWSGTGVTGGSFDPSAGTQTLTYSYTDGNGCSASCSTTITVNELPVVTCGSYGPVCTDAADIALGGSPSGGTWSGSGVTGNSFDPSVGTQTLTYSYTDGNGCSASCQTTITVNPLPVVTCGTYGPVCTDAADITLGGSPSGGTWSGTGVTGNSFDPSAGTQTVTYSFTDGNGCSASCSTTITVNPLPLVTCGSYGPVCADAADITLGGSPTGGTWSGTGVTGNSFDPGAGTQTVTYSYTDGNGCSASCSTTITVNELPVVTCGSYGPVCTDAADLALGGSPSGGTWSGTGVTGNSFDPSAGTQTVTYSYTDGNGCSASCSTTITVNPLPTVTCPSDFSVCIDMGAFGIFSGSPAGGTYSGPGISGNNFDPAAAGAGAHAITYSYTDGNGCTNTCGFTITVNALPVVTCGTYGPACDNDTPIALSGSPSGGTWSGTAVDGDSFDPALAGAGSWTLTYTYTDGSGCVNSCQTTIEVNTATLWYADADSDGHGDIDDPGVLACEQPLGTVSSNDDECDNDPLKVETGTCGCGVADTDTDSDTYADCIDGCPTDPLKQNPGACGCGVADADSDGDSYMDCMDGCPNDPNKIAPGVCGCGTADADNDGDGALNCNDACPNDPNKILNAGTCGCGNPEPGAACDDGNASTLNDVITGTCVCAGTPTTPIYSMELTTDAFGSQTSWDITPLAGGAPLCSGSGYPSSTTSTATCPLPDGDCYMLTVYDAMADGMCCLSGTGGYVLRTAGGQRIIDASGNGIFTNSASVSLGFCTPIGTDRLTDSRCDRVDYLPNDFVQAIPNAAVQAQYGTGNQTDDGYQFWFFNPNGGYSRRVLVTHANSSTIFPVGPDRCSYIRISSITTSPLPLNVLLNVRVRRQVNGVYAEFGPACRFKIDTETNCPTTQLVATAGSTFSCGISGVMLNGSRTLHAVVVSGANRYQFEFSKPGYLRKLTTTTSSLVLTQWNTLPLQYNSTYNVRVRISYDAGVTFCPFGAICTIATASSTSGMALAGDRDGASEREERILTMWPNPNSEGRVRFSMTGLGEGAHRVSVDLFDLLGARVQSEQLNIDGEELNTIVELIPGIQRGVYLVNVTVDDRLFTERLVVQ